MGFYGWVYSKSCCLCIGGSRLVAQFIYVHWIGFRYVLYYELRMEYRFLSFLKNMLIKLKLNSIGWHVHDSSHKQ